jgi:hypothetical protein
MRLNVLVNPKVERLLQSDRRRESRCIEPGCEQFATHISSDQEISNGILTPPAERLHCRHHAEQFAAERRIPMPV